MDSKLIETKKGQGFLGWSADGSRKVRVPIEKVRLAYRGEPACDECGGYLYACGFIWICTLCGTSYGRQWVNDPWGHHFLRSR